MVSQRRCPTVKGRRVGLLIALEIRCKSNIVTPRDMRPLQLAGMLQTGTAVTYLDSEHNAEECTILRAVDSSGLIPETNVFVFRSE